MPKRSASENFLLKAKELSKAEVELLFSRMGGKLERRLDGKKVVPLEALAIQLEIEDENLKEWRERFAEIKEKYHKQIKNAKI